MSEPNFDYVFEFNPQQVKILPKIEGQWKQLKNGNVKVWLTREQASDVFYLVDALLDGETNEFVAQGETEYALPDF